MKYLQILFFIFLFFTSCKERIKQEKNDYILQATEIIKSFPLDSNVKYNPFYLYVFEEEGKRYLSFLNYRSTELLFYDFDAEKFLFKTTLEEEGPDGVVMPTGYYVSGLNNIYVSTSAYSGLIKVDTTGSIIQKIPYGKTDTGYRIIPSYMPSSHPCNKPIFISDKMYITQKNLDRFCPSDKTPISVVVDTVKKEYASLPLTYGILTKKQLESNTDGFSRIYDGKNIIYSFYVDEDIIVTSVDHADVQRVKVKSRYIDAPDEQINFESEKAPMQVLTIPRYGDLIYDPYREVYYRFAYPKTELDSKVNWWGKAVYGRKKFSVIILDKDFRVIGETLFPEAVYNPFVAFVEREGLYISRDYQMNFEQSEDFMTFELFELVKNK